MCWGESGWWHASNSSDEAVNLDWAAVDRLVARVAKDSPSFILSGGEPFLYQEFENLAETLRSAGCFSIVCTNGTHLNRFPNLFDNNPFMTLLVSLDGLQQENDLLRGEGVYETVRENIRYLKSLKHPPYIGIQFTIRPENVHIINTFCSEMVRWDIDWLLLNPCWFITAEQAETYHRILRERYGIESWSQKGYLLPYPLDRHVFISQIHNLRDRRWPFQISCYLKKPEEIHRYLDQPHIPTRNSFCYKQWLRMDITPTGDITPCAQFPDIVFGNIMHDDILAVWNSDAYRFFREDIRERLLPVCSKCDGLYLYDAKRKYL